MQEACIFDVSGNLPSKISTIHYYLRYECIELHTHLEQDILQMKK